MVSCTGSQFCGFALAETKSRAVAMMESLERQLDLPRPVRVHFTGCPNSCGQAQVRGGVFALPPSCARSLLTFANGLPRRARRPLDHGRRRGSTRWRATSGVQSILVCVQVGDIGLMGAPAKKDGKATEGFKIFLGGKIGENPELAKEFGQVRSVRKGRRRSTPVGQQSREQEGRKGAREARCDAAEELLSSFA